jgi:phosphoribosyl 1,2-cyclic phosphodiesterase
MKVTCYGSRGSIPSPSRKGRNGQPDFITYEYGGNTTCYHIEAGPFSLILDLGSGVANLGDDLMKTGKGFNKEHIVLISHYHWDHLQGGPFFVPFFIQSNKFHFHGFAPAGMETESKFDRTVEHLLSEQQVSPHFPVAHGALPSKKKYKSHQRQFAESFWYYIDEKGKLEFQHEFLPEYDTKGTLPMSAKSDPKNWIKITTIPLNHPDGCLGYRIEYMGKVAVYATDFEPLRFASDALVKASKGAHWLLLDGQYEESKIATTTQTFGHGTPKSCVEQAGSSELNENCYVIIHHHDPKHDDQKLYELEVECYEYAKAMNIKNCSFAREGMVWEI